MVQIPSQYLQLLALFILIVSFTCLGRNSPLFYKGCRRPIAVTGPFIRNWRRRSQTSHHHVQGVFGHSSAVAKGGERVTEAGTGGGVCCSASGQHAAYCSGYVWVSLCWGLISLGPSRQHTPCQNSAVSGLEYFSFYAQKTQNRK